MSVVAFSDVERVTETNVCRDRPRGNEEAQKMARCVYKGTSAKPIRDRCRGRPASSIEGPPIITRGKARQLHCRGGSGPDSAQQRPAAGPAQPERGERGSRGRNPGTSRHDRGQRIRDGGNGDPSSDGDRGPFCRAQPHDCNADFPVSGRSTLQCLKMASWFLA